MRVVFRCDGTREVGLGHLSRCVALAEAMEERGCTTSFIGEYDDVARAMLGDRRRSRVPLGSVNAISTKEADMIVVDGYSFDADAILVLGPELPPARRVLIDDFASHAAYPPATILNFTVDAEKKTYGGAPYKLLLGPSYFLARRRLRLLRRTRADRPYGGRILIAIGGHDRRGVTLRCARALLRCDPQLSIHAVLRPDHPDAAELETVLSRGRECGVLSNLPDLSTAFAWADACMSGGGLTKYEAAFLRVPVAVVSQTHEEAMETESFARRGLATDIGLHDVTDESLSVRVATWLGVLGSGGLAGMPDVFGEDPTAHAADQLLGAE